MRFRTASWLSDRSQSPEMSADYLARLRTGGAGSSETDARLPADLCEAGWRRTFSACGLEIWTRGAPALPVSQSPDGRVVVIGRHYARGRSDPLAMPVAMPPDSPPIEGARRLVSDHWGSYVALLRNTDGAWGGVLRDPSGALDAFSWCLGDEFILASDLAPVPGPLRPVRLSLDWDAIAEFVRRPASVAARSALSGLSTLCPGDYRPVDERTADLPLWRPAAFARQAPAAGPEAEAALRKAVDVATAGLVSSYDRCLLEVSGGLDSAIVAAAVRALGLSTRVAAVVHMCGDRPEADERIWARLASGDLWAAAELIPAEIPDLQLADVLALAGGARPAMNALDLNGDLAIRALASSRNAEAVITGKGGDSIFFQHPTALVISDYVRATSARRLLGAETRAVARRLRRSVWSVAWEAWSRRHSDGAEARSLPIWGPRVLARPEAPAHPWQEDVGDLPPAKRYQIGGVVMTQLNRGVSRAGRLVDQVHPLLAQPVLEAGFALGTWTLQRGGRDRGLVRDLFEHRLHPDVAGRRSKADWESFYTRTVAQNLPFLRSFLLDGCLANAGILDRAGLDQVLNADALIWQADSSGVLAAAALEAWVRHWQTRVPDAAGAPRGRSLLAPSFL